MIANVTIKSAPLFMGDKRVKRASDWQRFEVLSQGPLICFECGCKATHFLIERHRNENYYHINVYAGDRMLTWDHIIPKSLGGSNHVHNGRVACENCNSRRGNDMTVPELLWALRQDPNKVYKHGTPWSKLRIDSMRKFQRTVNTAKISAGALSRV